MKQLITLSMACILCFISMGCDLNSNENFIGASSEISVDQQLNMLQQSAWVHVVQTTPVEIVTVDAMGTSAQFWPYTGQNFSATPQDPINLIFLGNADPRDIRAALMKLDGDRTAFGFPNDAPFNSTWIDAIGEVQTSYEPSSGWNGSSVQLECGGYGPLRFHVRFFRMNGFTVANAHFELLIPGTTDHQVLNWELAEQFVMVDIIRTGLLGAEPGQTDEINMPNFRSIPAVVYNLLPVELRGLIGGPLSDVGDDVSIGGDGKATVLYMYGKETPVPDIHVQDFVITFDQVIPKPFCSDSEYDYLYVYGDIHLYQTSEITGSGDYRTQFNAEGILSATPINPLTGEAVGEPMEAVVNETHTSFMSDSYHSAGSRLFQKLLPTSDENSGWLFKRLRVNGKGNNGYEERVSCGDDLMS